MEGFNFTERVRTCLAMAREEAARLHHEYVGTEHILLGVIREGEGVASAVLANLDADVGAIRQKIEETVKTGKALGAGPDLPYTSRAKKVLELAMSEARQMSHSYVGTEHLLLGLLREEKGIAAQVLVDSGVTLEAARAATLRILTSDDSPRESDFLFAARLPGHGGRTRRGWFKPWGWTYRPASAQGAVITLLAFAFCVNVFVAVDRNSHSVSDTLYGIFPFVVPTLILLNWIASKSSR